MVITYCVISRSDGFTGFEKCPADGPLCPAAAYEYPQDAYDCCWITVDQNVPDVQMFFSGK